MSTIGDNQGFARFVLRKADTNRDGEVSKQELEVYKETLRPNWQKRHEVTDQLIENFGTIASMVGDENTISYRGRRNSDLHQYVVAERNGVFTNTEPPAPETEAPAPAQNPPAPEAEAPVPAQNPPAPETEAPAPAQNPPAPEAEAPSQGGGGAGTNTLGGASTPTQGTESQPTQNPSPAPQTETSNQGGGGTNTLGGTPNQGAGINTQALDRIRELMNRLG